jgi:hypothetical protein
VIRAAVTTEVAVVVGAAARAGVAAPRSKPEASRAVAASRAGTDMVNPLRWSRCHLDPDVAAPPYRRDSCCVSVRIDDVILEGTD